MIKYKLSNNHIRYDLLINTHNHIVNPFPTEQIRFLQVGRPLSLRTGQRRISDVAAH